MENKPKKQSLEIVQPNKVTNARYDYTAVQENALTCMMDALQGHMTQERPIQTDLFGHPTVRIKASDVAVGKHKTYVIEQLRELRKKDIEFEYLNEEKKQEKVITGLISAIRTVRDSDYIDVELSTWAVPYLLYWGKGVGGTLYSKVTALTVRGIYAKRIYKLCCRWQDQGGFSMTIEEFRGILELERKYPRLAELRKWVLEPAKQELSKTSPVTFDYDWVKVNSKSYNVLKFKVFSNKATKPAENTAEWYTYVYNFICRTYPSYTSNKAQVITDKLNEDLRMLAQAFQKFQRLDDEFSSGSKRSEDIIKLTKHILKQDFNII